MAIVAVDFDMTIHNASQPKPGKRMGEPMPGAVEAMQALKAAGNILIVHTVWRQDRWHVIREWCDYYHIPYDDVTNIKPTATAYIDDRAIRFEGSWPDVLEKIYESR